MTGLRVGTLANVKHHHLQSILNHQDFTISLIKNTGPIQQQTFPWQSAYSKIVQLIESDIKALIDSTKPDGSPFALSREHINRMINKILKEASSQTGKHLRSQSFRRESSLLHIADVAIEQSGLHVESEENPAITPPPKPRNHSEIP